MTWRRDSSANAPEASALVVEAPPADEVVGSWRLRYDPVASHGMPAHVTVLYPFCPPSRIDGSTLAGVLEAIAGHQPFDVVFGAVDTFGANVVYLRPEPAEPFVRLTDAIATAFPDYPPYSGAFDDTIPHLTIGHTSSAAASSDLAAAVERRLGGRRLAHHVNEVALFTRAATGGWSKRASFPLGVG